MKNQKLSFYEITDQIGAGGMGEVYRARDTKLGRDVALKILPDSFVHDSERLARFDREARVLASLNHPNIASIYGLEDADAKKFLVLELVDGEDLSKRIGRGALPVEESLETARQISEALEAAHEQGVVHRDLKPGNIVTAADGRVKVLDFGLAKAFEVDASDSDNISQSPTVLGTGATAHGVILGTAAYMSPEQARGKQVDRRADIFAFGCVLFEMLTGRQCFTGETVSDTLAAVLRAEPDWEALPGETPLAVRDLLRRCLDKDPRSRLRDIGEARITLERVQNGEIADPELPAVEAAAPANKSRLSVLGYLPYAVAIVAMILAFTFYKNEKPEIIRASILPPDETPFDLRGYHPGPAVISPDGSKIAYTARGSSGTLLYVRFLDEAVPRALPGTEGAGYHFWSPDSRSLAFFGDSKLKRVEISGAPPITLCDAAGGKGGSWNQDDVIVFAPSFNTGVSKIPATGGEPEQITSVHLEQGENSHRFPEFLPDGGHFIYLARGAGASQRGQAGTSIRLASLDGEIDRVLMPSISNAVYANGHLLFLREDVLMARPFDTDKLELSGEAFPIAHQVRYIPGAARGIFSASQDGKLVYQAGSSLPGNQLVWVDLEGNEISRMGDPAEHDVLRLSPDGNRVAVEVYDEIGGTADVWIYEIDRGIRTRFTFDPAPDNSPVWSPDGNEIIFGSARASHTDLYRKSIGGSGTEVLILQDDFDKWPTDWSYDGRYVLYNRSSQSQSIDIWAFPVEGDGEPFAVLATEHTEFDARFSPDDRWISYVSNESGAPEVYVRPFPGPGRRWQVSAEGGAAARWGGDGRQLFFQSMDGSVHIADVNTSGDTFGVGRVSKLFETSVTPDYQISADGQKVLLIKESDVHHLTPLTLVLNWLDDPNLRRN
jgi:serine/threonine protein kinase/Tol biopolymer transport system component